MQRSHAESADDSSSVTRTVPVTSGAVIGRVVAFVTRPVGGEEMKQCNRLFTCFFFIVNVLSVSIEATFIEKVITAFEERLLSTSNRVNSLEKGNSAAMLLSQMSPDAAKINFERMARARYYTGCCLRIRTRKTFIIYVYILSGNICTMYAHECFLDSVYALSLTNV